MKVRVSMEGVEALEFNIPNEHDASESWNRDESIKIGRKMFRLAHADDDIVQAATTDEIRVEVMERLQSALASTAGF